MVVHIDPNTGQPIFILDQILLVKELKIVYDKYGIHGIQYCFLFGWCGSPFATITNAKERHEVVAKQVYSTHYYDPIQKTLIKREKLRQQNQFDEFEIKEAIDLINKLGRVPILEEKQMYLTVLDKIKAGLLADLDTRNADALKKSTDVQKVLIDTSKKTTEALRDTIAMERELMVKKDEKASLNHFF